MTKKSVRLKQNNDPSTGFEAETVKLKTNVYNYKLQCIRMTSSLLPNMPHLQSGVRKRVDFDKSRCQIKTTEIISYLCTLRVISPLPARGR